MNDVRKWPNRREILVAGAASVAGFAFAQGSSWQPAKPIRIICGQAPGASTDATARALAEYMSQKFGVPVTVENRPGGVGMIAGEVVAHSAPDGLTLLMTLQSSMAQAPALLKNPPVNPDKDLVPIAAYGVGPVVGVLYKDFPATTLADVVAIAKKKPVSVGNYAIGSGWQLMLNQLAKDTGATFTVVNYKGTGAMLADLFAGHIDMGAGSLAGMAGGLQKGYVKPVVITTGGRSAKLPGVPPWVEAGYKGPAYEDLAEMNLLMAPAGTPLAIINTLANLASASITDSPRVKTVRETLGADDVPLVGADLRQFISRSWPTYRRISKEMNLSID